MEDVGGGISTSSQSETSPSSLGLGCIESILFLSLTLKLGFAVGVELILEGRGESVRGWVATTDGGSLKRWT